MDVLFLSRLHTWQRNSKTRKELTEPNGSQSENKQWCCFTFLQWKTTFLKGLAFQWSQLRRFDFDSFWGICLLGLCCVTFPSELSVRNPLPVTTSQLQGSQKHQRTASSLPPTWRQGASCLPHRNWPLFLRNYLFVVLCTHTEWSRKCLTHV